MHRASLQCSLCLILLYFTFDVPAEAAATTNVSGGRVHGATLTLNQGRTVKQAYETQAQGPACQVTANISYVKVTDLSQRTPNDNKGTHNNSKETLNEYKEMQINHKEKLL